jgi:hypothetical protein
MKMKIAVVAAVAAVTSAAWTPVANADVHPGCQNDRWGFLGTQTRSICDGPLQADGSWVRFRMVWVPAHQVPISTYCSSYSCSTSGGYWQDEQVFEKVKYPVTPDTVVAGEPAWLAPTYTDAGGFTPVNFN